MGELYVNTKRLMKEPAGANLISRALISLLYNF